MLIAPIPMLLWCPECKARHIDAVAADGTDWSKKLHHTHSCQTCGHVWRPCLLDTIGVQFLPGFKNNEVPAEPDPMDPGMRVLIEQLERVAASLSQGLIGAAPEYYIRLEEAAGRLAPVLSRLRLDCPHLSDEERRNGAECLACEPHSYREESMLDSFAKERTNYERRIQELEARLLERKRRVDG